jgi:hypothetical protein
MPGGYPEGVVVSEHVQITDRIDKYRRMMMLVKYLSMSVRFFNLDILIKQFSTKFDCIGVFVSCSDQEF